jgi:hypothetical protein
MSTHMRPFQEFTLASPPIIQALTTHMASMYLRVDMNNKAELKTNTISSTGSADILQRQIILNKLGMAVTVLM